MKVSFRACLLCRALLVAVLLPGAASAASEFVVLNNGDKITGTIKSIWDEELKIEPDYADDILVDTDAIAYIESDRVFDIEWLDGVKADAEFKGADAEGKQIVVIDGKSRSVPFMDIAELSEPDDYYDWDSRLDANTVVNQGNTDSSTVRITGNSELKLGDHHHILDLVLANETLNEETTKQQTLITYNYGWLFTEDNTFFLGGSGSYERDPIRNLEDRYTAGVGLGYNFWDDAWRALTMQAGVGGRTENIDDMREDTLIGFWSLRFSYDLVGGDLNIYHNHNYSTAISGRDNDVLKTTTGLRYSITDLLYANFEVVYDYETNPAADAQNEDLSVVVGLGIEW